jgi:hypothetical protein
VACKKGETHLPKTKLNGFISQEFAAERVSTDYSDGKILAAVN